MLDLPVSSTRNFNTLADVPTKAHADDAAFDLRASMDVYLASGEVFPCPVGLTMAIPEGHAGLILPRSGLAAKYGVTVLNAPGLIDPGYRGEVKVLLYAVPLFDELVEAAKGNRPTAIRFSAKKGDRIAQLLIVKATEVCPVLYMRDRMPASPSERGVGGFGSSGLQ